MAEKYNPIEYISYLYQHAQTYISLDHSFNDVMNTPEDRIAFLTEIIDKLDNIQDIERKNNLIIYLEKNIEIINETPNAGLIIDSKYVTNYDKQETIPTKEEIEVFFKILKKDLEIFMKKSTYKLEVPLSELYKGVSEKLTIKPHNIVHMIGLTKTHQDSLQENLLEELKTDHNIEGIITPEEGVKLILDNFETYKQRYIKYINEMRQWDENYKKTHPKDFDENGITKSKKQEEKYKNEFRKKFGKKFIYFNQNYAKLISFYNFTNFNNLNEIIVDYETNEMHNIRINNGKIRKEAPDVYLASYDISNYYDSYKETLAGGKEEKNVSLTCFSTDGFERTQENIEQNIEMPNITFDGTSKSQIEASVYELNNEYYRYSHYFFIDIIKEDDAPKYISNAKQKIVFYENHKRYAEADNLFNKLDELNHKWENYLLNYLKKQPIDTKDKRYFKMSSDMQGHRIKATDIFSKQLAQDFLEKIGKIKKDSNIFKKNTIKIEDRKKIIGKLRKKEDEIDDNHHKHR